MILLTNTLSGKKEPFQSLQKNKVSLYVCGITPYDYAHIGHGRCYIMFDILYRLLKIEGYEVSYCRNYTDIDDKLLNRAEQELGNRLLYKDIAKKYIDAFQEEMRLLNNEIPDYEPRVTHVIPDIRAFIQRLIDNGYAYKVEGGDVYYSVKKCEQYGQLSKRNLENLLVGARVELNDKKQDPLDFALWKADEDEKSLDFWNSPWGYGRPGWHIECSAMALKYLGEQIDIHGGGMDLIFPHHENEIAQSEAVTGKQFARFWIHNAFVRVDKEKMSKSAGNFYTLRDLFKQVDPMVVRFYILNHHYRSPLDFSFEDLHIAEKVYAKLCKSFSDVDSSELSVELFKNNDVVQRMLSFVQDDLNTVGMWGVVFENLNRSPEIKSSMKKFLQQVLGLTLIPLKEEIVETTPEIQRLLHEREQARAQRDWSRADELRDRLQSLGVDVQDKKST